MVRENLEQKAIKGAIEHGLKELFGRNKYLFSGMENYLSMRLDKKRINSKISEIYKIMEDENMGSIEGSNFLYNKLKKYIASGSMFDIEGGESFLRRGLEKRMEEKGFFAKIKSFFEYLTKPKEQKYFEKTLKSAIGLYESFIEGGGSDTPEFRKYAAYLGEMNALSPFLKIMKKKKIKTRDEIKELYKEAAMGIEYKAKGLEKYVTQKIAASILGIFGISLITVSSRITGAVIGVQNNIILCIIGTCMVVGSLLLIFNLSKKKLKE